MDKLFCEGLLRQFKIHRQVKDILLQWAAKMAELLIFGLPTDQWAVEVHQLRLYCQKNRLQQFASFDPLQQFQAFMEEWRQLVIGKNQLLSKQVQSVNPNVSNSNTVNSTNSLNSSNPSNPNRHSSMENEYPSLTELLLDNLNLNLQCEALLQELEQRLIQQIRSGSKVEYTIAQVRSFCRCHAGEKGFYDERGRLNYLVGVWYDIVNESRVAPVNIDLTNLPTDDDDGDFDSIMRDISEYVNQHEAQRV
jgi:hypothetical protein